MNKINKVISVVLITLIALLMVSCNKNSQALSGNDQFISAFEKAINTRWTKQDKLQEKRVKYTDTEYKQETIEILNEEINTLEAAAVGIEDINLKNIANNYIEGVNLQIEASNTTDYNLSYDYSTQSDVLRKPALLELVETYGVKINEEHQQTYKDFKSQAIIIKKENTAREYAEKLISELQFEKIVDEYGYVKFTAIAENTSDVDFDSISYNVQYKDADGIVVYTGYLYINSFTVGSKQKVELDPYEKGIESFNIILDYVYTK